MTEFQISDFLQNRDNKTNRGYCKICLAQVYWSKDRVKSHKRISCTGASAEEKRKFAKRKPEKDLSHGNQSNDSQNSNTENDLQNLNCSQCTLSDEKIKDIHKKFANFFFRTGVSLRLADSAAFKDFVKSLNASYAAKMPTSKHLSGSLLDNQFKECSSLLDDILTSSKHLTLITDGWTNIRGDHIVNFCIKAPDQKPFFYSSINTSGISQNSQAVANAIIEVIEKLGSMLQL